MLEINQIHQLRAVPDERISRADSASRAVAGKNGSKLNQTVGQSVSGHLASAYPAWRLQSFRVLGGAAESCWATEDKGGGQRW